GHVRASCGRVGVLPADLRFAGLSSVVGARALRVARAGRGRRPRTVHDLPSRPASPLRLACSLPSWGQRGAREISRRLHTAPPPVSYGADGGDRRMEPSILADLMALGRVLTIFAAVVLPALALHRAGEWLRSRRQRALTPPLPVATGRRPAPGRSRWQCRSSARAPSVPSFASRTSSSRPSTASTCHGSGSCSGPRTSGWRGWPRPHRRARSSRVPARSSADAQRDAMHMELYLAQKLTEARIGDLRAASARAVL